MEIHKNIIEAIQNDNLVIFCGSGLSIRFSLPNWYDLVKSIILDINDDKLNLFVPVLDNELLSPIEILERLKDYHNDIKKYIKNNFDIKEKTNLQLHKNIISLSGKIITTNYDNAFEVASSNNIIPAIYTSNFNVSEINKNKENYIFKLHGSFTEPDHCIIFQDQYDALYQRDTAAKEKLKSIFTDKVILFLGFSFNDPDINLIFDNLDRSFGNNNKHYILTTDTTKFIHIKFLQSIQISSYNDIDAYIDKCLEYKKNGDHKILISENTSIAKTVSEIKPRIAILSPKPIDIDFNNESNQVIDCFNNIDADIYLGTLNISTLQDIEDFDLLIIISKTYKSLLYIEQENLKSDLLSVEEICLNIPNDSIPIAIISNDKLPTISNRELINIYSFKSALIKRFIFKLLREGKTDFTENEIDITSIYNPKIKIAKGIPRISSIYGNNRDLDIGKKSLTNIIGRVEEQASIALMIKNIIRTNKLLNIKASGGTGKTTLIKKISYELYNRGYFKQGVTFNSCENVKSFEDFEDILATGFNLKNILNFKDYLQDNFSNNKNDILIILDNFETVVNNLEKDSFKKVIDLLNFATDYANVVITSREKISNSNDFEDVYSLTPLITDDAERLFITNYGSIKSVDEIKILRSDILEDLLNNNPLAIKLVTKSRLKSKHISELRDQIKEHFFESINEDYSSVFSNNSDLNIERTKSIFQSINYSYTTLKPSEKIVFELLSLFPDGISLNNFKKCFEKSNSKNKISDRELRVLKDKSLVEDYNGILQLQPIIRRFADYHFNKRSDDAKMKFCADAYLFNSFILRFIEYVHSKKNESEALKVFNLYKNNLIKVLQYIPNIEILANSAIDDKQFLLNYIDGISDYIMNEKEISELYKELSKVQKFFDELPKAKILINVIEKSMRYFFEEFDRSYKSLIKILHPDDMEKRILKDETVIENTYLDKIANIHSMEGHTLAYINSYIINNNYDTYFDGDFIYLGILNSVVTEKAGFYHYENQLMSDRLDIAKLEKYINGLHSDQHLEIMQSTYTLSKVKKVSSKYIQKLVVTNPYTKGLKQLMEAFINDSDYKEILFKKAISNLYHIKYYYLEALYYYCKFLKEKKDIQYEEKLNYGLTLSKRFKYQYLDYLFTNLKYNDDVSYSFSYDYYENDKLEEYINKYNKKWNKYFREKNIFEG